MSEYAYKVTAAGRVNIIGEHVDYCGGKVFPAALSLKNTVYIRPNGTNKINIKWTTLRDTVSLDIRELNGYKGLRYGNYHAGAALMLQSSGRKVIGCDILQDCAVPFGSGLSSSAAIEVGAIAALATVAEERLDNKEIALMAQRVEREYVGVDCGIMDQYASANGKKGCAMLLDCKAVAHEYVPFASGDYELVIIDSNKPHNLAESKYNERRRETEQALKTLQAALPVTCLAEVTEEQFRKYGRCLSGKIYDRAKHVVEECARVELAAKAVRDGNITELGQLLNASHKSLKELYEVTGRELDALAETAQKHPACVGSRMTGAGFGGCAISLVNKDGVEDFKRVVADEYRKRIGYDCKIYDAQIADGITVTKL